MSKSSWFKFSKNKLIFLTVMSSIFIILTIIQLSIYDFGGFFDFISTIIHYNYFF